MSDPEFAQLRADLAEATRRMFWTLDSALENLLAIGAIDEGQAAEARSRMQGKYHSPFGPPAALGVKAGRVKRVTPRQRA